jgi:hypothetical protein
MKRGTPDEIVRHFMADDTAAQTLAGSTDAELAADVVEQYELSPRYMADLEAAFARFRLCQAAWAAFWAT